MNLHMKILSATVGAGIAFTTALGAAQAFPGGVSVLAGESNVLLAQAMPPRDEPGRWHGYEGSRERRDGYRRHSDGWWYPLAAFAVGAAVGGAVSGAANDAPPPPPAGDMPPPPPRHGDMRPGDMRPGDMRSGEMRGGPRDFSPEHYAWCAKRYRSYRAGDNSYVPRAGVRAQCVSPFR